jgi:hypothetical protein
MFVWCVHGFRVAALALAIFFLQIFVVQPHNNNIGNKVSHKHPSTHPHHDGIQKFAHDPDYVNHLRQKYESKFESICPKFPFVKDYQDLLRNPSNKYMIFMYHEDDAPTEQKGGLGDRLAGLVTAIAWAMRTRRNFLLQGDMGLQTYFKPRVTHPELKPEDFSWSNWSWSGWKDEHRSAPAVDMHCVNPHQRNTPVCALDWQFYEKDKIIKYRSNRTYLCRWMANLPDLDRIQAELLATLGINRETNLYEVAGCLLRLVLHPTNELWLAFEHLSATARLHEVVSGTANHVNDSGQKLTNIEISNKPNKTFHSLQVGVHFRCGDLTGFDHIEESKKKCIASPNGTYNHLAFMDDFSPDSPLDIAKCASRIMGNREATLYVASDNIISSKQITTFQSWPHVVQPTSACHIDFHGVNNPSCGLHTLVQWFFLSQSDAIVTQSLQRKSYSTTYDRPHVKARLQAGYPESHAPVSAFSRFAIIYGLAFANMSYGIDCNPVNTTTLGHYTHGNWVCYPLNFY